MKSVSPELFLGVAGRFLLVACGVCLPALLAVNAAIDDRVAPPIDPTDDEPWLEFAPSIAAWPTFEAVQGATPEQVVERLGPPLRVHRGSDLCDRCAQTFVYAALLDGQPSWRWRLHRPPRPREWLLWHGDAIRHSYDDRSGRCLGHGSLVATHGCPGSSVRSVEERAHASQPHSAHEPRVRERAAEQGVEADEAW